jgi:hypothetical protein
VYVICIKPIFRDHLSEVTLFQCSLNITLSHCRHFDLQANYDFTLGFQWGWCCLILSFLCSEDHYLSFVPDHLAIVLSLFLRFTTSDYPFILFRLFLMSVVKSLTNVCCIVMLHIIAFIGLQCSLSRILVRYILQLSKSTKKSIIIQSLRQKIPSLILFRTFID